MLKDCKMIRVICYAADYLHVEDLLVECGVRIAKNIRDRSVKDIRRFLRVCYDDDEDDMFES